MTDEMIQTAVTHLAVFAVSCMLTYWVGVLLLEIAPHLRYNANMGVIIGLTPFFLWFPLNTVREWWEGNHDR